MARKVTKAQADKALAAVALEIRRVYRTGAKVPTGPDAAYHGDGPELNMAWTWPGVPTPTILLESSMFSDWAVAINTDAVGRAAGVYAEPWAGYALCLYPRWTP